MRVLGEVDAFNVDRLLALLTEFTRRDCASIVDLSGLRFCGVAGVQMLCRLQQHCEAEGARWALVVGPLVGRLLHLCPVDEALPIEPSVEAALERVRRAGEIARYLQLVQSTPPN